MRDERAGARMTRREALGVLPLVPALATGLVSGVTRRQASAANRGGRLVAGLPVDILNYDPFLGAVGTHQYMLARGIFETLTRYNEKLEPQPELATSWNISDNGLQLTLNLRKGTKFHSGREFTADDVVFSLRTVQDPKYAALNRPLALPLTAEAKDKYTVTLSTEKPYAAIFDALDGLFIVDRDTAEPGFPQKAVGTGPFKQGQRVPGDFARFERFDDYWGGPAPLDGFELRPVPDLSALAISLESGALDVAWRLSYPDYVRLRNTGKFQVLPGAPAASYYDLTLNTTTPVFKDKRVRQAIYQALDMEAIKSRIMGGTSHIAGTMVAPGINGYDAKLDVRLPFNPDASKKLLAEAGYPSGFEIGMDCPNDRYVNDEKICQAIVGMLARVDIKVNLLAQTRTKYFEKILSRNTTFSILGWQPLSYDAHSTLQDVINTPVDKVGTYNVGSFSNARIDALTNQIEVEGDPAKRQALISEALGMHKAEIGHIPLHQAGLAWGVRKGVSVVLRNDDSLELRWVKVED